MVADVDLGLNVPATFPLVTLEKLLVVVGDVDIDPITDTLSAITHAAMVYCCVYLVLLVMLVIFFIKI